MRLWAAALLIALSAGVLFVSADPAGSDHRQLFGLWRASRVALAGGLLLAGVGCGLSHGSRPGLLRYLFLLVLGGATVLLLELAGFAGLVSYPSLFGNRRLIPTNTLGAQPVPHLDVRGSTTQDTATAWGLSSEPIPFRYQTDRHGFRNPSDRQSADIYLLGDSIVVAALVPFELTMTALLADQLNRRVMNVALIGISPQREADLFRAAELPVQGRSVLHFIFEGNDLLDSASYGRKFIGNQETRLALADRSFTRNAVLALQRWTQPVVGLAKRRVCTISDQTYTFQWTANAYRGVEAEQAKILAALEVFGSEVEAAGGRYAIVFVPTKLRVLGPVCQWPEVSDLVGEWERNPLRDTVHRWSRTSGARLIDLTEPLRAAARRGEPPWFWGDTHWNATGHAVAARAIARDLNDTLLAE